MTSARGLMQQRERERPSSYIPDLTTFLAMIDSFERSIFRLETLAEYRVEEEAEKLRRYIEGKPLPDPDPAHDSWRTALRRHAEAGRTVERLRTLPPGLTPYLRFEIEWAYLYSWEAGERIYLAGDDALALLPERARRDFYLFDDRTVVLMHYDAVGRPAGRDLIEDPDEIAVYRRAREAALSAATPLPEYLAARRRA